MGREGRFETHPCPGQPEHLCGIGFSAIKQICVRFQQNKGCIESAHIPQTYLLLFYIPPPHHLTPGRRRLHFVVWARGSHGRSLRWGVTKFQYSTVGRVEHQEVALISLMLQERKLRHREATPPCPHLVTALASKRSP